MTLTNQASPLPLGGGDYELVFDGGALGNPGKGYGSFEITRGADIVLHQRLDFGDQITNNQAEYRTLIGALEWLATALGPAAAQSTVSVHGDSQLVLYQLGGRWKVKNEGLRSLFLEASRAIRTFRNVELVWQPRSESVKRLGH